MRKTIKKVTMVVLVLITNCQVSLYRKIGPVAAQIRMIIRAMIKVGGRPAKRAVHFAKCVKRDVDFIGLMVPPLKKSRISTCKKNKI